MREALERLGFKRQPLHQFLMRRTIRREERERNKVGAVPPFDSNAVTMGQTWLPCEKAVINPYIWCAVGAVIGFALGTMLGKASRTGRVEDVLVGIFGAFIGGEFAADMLRGPIATSTQGFGTKLLLAVLGALLMLGLLALMRRAVGPMRNSKSRSRNRN